jgi:peptidyl-tRNA hydrolase
MNRSGLSARQFYDYHKLGIPPEQFLVIYDCIDLPIGTTRLREGIKNRSHNGLQSIFQQFQMNQVDAIQIGILPQELADCYQGKFDDLGVGRLEFYVLSRVGTQNKQKIVSSFREAEGLVL